MSRHIDTNRLSRFPRYRTARMEIAGPAVTDAVHLTPTIGNPLSRRVSTARRRTCAAISAAVRRQMTEARAFGSFNAAASCDPRVMRDRISAISMAPKPHVISVRSVLAQRFCTVSANCLPYSINIRSSQSTCAVRSDTSVSIRQSGRGPVAFGWVAEGTYQRVGLEQARRQALVVNANVAAASVVAEPAKFTRVNGVLGGKDNPVRAIVPWEALVAGAPLAIGSLEP